MANSRDKYYTKVYETRIDYNDRNDASLYNKNILDAIHKVIDEEELDAHYIILDAHNVTVDNFSQTSNTQRENSNAILTSEKLDKSDALAEMLKELTINDAGYYASDSANANDAICDPASDPKTVTHTSDGNKRKVTDTSNRDLQQKLLSNRTLPIVTTTMDPRIDNRIATCGEIPHTLALR